VGGRQAQVGQALLAALQHAVEGGQVLAVLDGMPGALEDVFHRIIRQGLQPQFLDLPELFGIREGGVVLVVVVQPEQGEDLVQCFDVGLARLGAPRFSLPRRCR
jgi:hypothetical protein